MPPRVEELDNPQGYGRIAGGSRKDFAARAWEGYLHYGRGALVIKMAKVQEVKRSPGYYSVSSEYAPEGSELLAEVGLWPDERLAKILREYNPEREVVLVFVSLKGVANCYTLLLPESISPQEAYIAWREKHPIGIRINPNTSVEEALKIFIALEFERKKAWDAECEQILSDPARQAGFLKCLIELQESLQAELEAGGIGIYPGGGAYLKEELTSPQRTSYERLKFLISGLEYLVITTVVNRAAQVYEENKARGNNQFKEAARIALETIDDKTTVIMASQLSSRLAEESDLAEDEEGIRNIFLVFTTARLRVRLKKYPRIMSALEAEAQAEGKSVDEVLLSKLLTGVCLSWAEYEKQPHVPFINDSKGLIRGFAKEVFDEALSAQRGKLTSVDGLPNEIHDPAFEKFKRQQDARADLAAAIKQANLTDYEMKAWLLQQIDGYSGKEIARILKRKEGQVKQALRRARQKLDRLSPAVGE